MNSEKTEAKCPFSQATGAGTTSRDWWPQQLRLDLLPPALLEVRIRWGGTSITPRPSRASTWPR
jgi:hypothetical protein